VYRTLAILSLTLAAQNWPQFRGPNAAGLADHSTFPDRWSETENIAWKTPIPGMAWSSPVLWGDRIYVTTAISSADFEPPKKGLYFGGNRGKVTDVHRLLVMALDAKSGKVIWEREVWKGVPPQSRHLKNSFASETPVTDGNMIYALFGNNGLWALTKDGKIAWTLPLDANNTRYGWGTAASPVLHQGRLYILKDNDDASVLLSVDAKTGKIIWKADRAGEKSNWSTPFIWQHDSKTEIITTGTVKNRSYDLDGKVIWEFGGMSTIAIPTPLERFGMLFLTSGYVGDNNRPVFVVKPGAKGTLGAEHIAWQLPQAGPYNPSPIIYGNYYYTLMDRGFFTAHDARTGTEIYGKQRIDPAAAAFTASPWASREKIYVASEDGDTFVIAAGKEYKLLHKNTLSEMIMATPAIGADALYIRGAQSLYKIKRP
jgi:hypothetical protein